LWTQKRSSFTLDTCLIIKDKRVIWCHVTTILLEDNGATLGYTNLEDITARKEAEIELREANDRERLLEQRILQLTINVQEKERSRIAYDLHDSLGQMLFAIQLQLGGISIANPDKLDHNTLLFEQSKQLLSESINECRRISHNLIPTVLKDFGLEEAIKEICMQFSGRIEFKCELKGTKYDIPKHLKTTIYRIVQELATNIVKHSSATNALIRLKVSNPDIELQIEDNGKGLQYSEYKEDGIGIRSIKTKLHLLQGKLKIQSAPGDGTKVYITIPNKDVKVMNNDKEMHDNLALE
ncbi:MAG: PAS domain-containing sensor histidine kinase, partial [Flavobacterium sp.]